MHVTGVALGFVIGLLLGMLGSGGSILTVPVFVHILGFGAKDSIAMSLVVVGTTSLVGGLGQWWKGRANIRVASIFGGVAIVGTYLGTRLATRLSGTEQLGIFATIMMVAAGFMLRGRQAEAGSRPAQTSASIPSTAIQALVVGSLTGLVGVGGGFLIVPALVWGGLPMRDAVGTSLLIIAMNCVMGFYGYLGQVKVVWLSVALVTAGTIPGIATGTYAMRFVSQQALRRGFAVLLFGVAVYMLYQNLGAPDPSAQSESFRCRERVLSLNESGCEIALGNPVIGEEHLLGMRDHCPALVTWRASVVSFPGRTPTRRGCRSLPCTVHSMNATCTTISGRTQCARSRGRPFAVANGDAGSSIASRRSVRAKEVAEKEADATLTFQLLESSRLLPLPARRESPGRGSSSRGLLSVKGLVMKRIVRRLTVTSVACLVAGGAVIAQGPMDKFVPLTLENLHNPDPADWPMLGGNMAHWNYSSLDQINRENIGSLQLVWARQMPTTGGRAATSPLIHKGIMYLISPNDALVAVDAVTGSRIWEYHRELPKAGEGPGLIRHNYSGPKRGIALYGDKIFTVASDNAVIALDARTGKLVWEVFRGGDGYVANTSGPIIANGILVAGGSCQNAPFGCYVTGHDIATGKELWRNEVIPRPGRPGDETWGGTTFESRWCTGVWGQIVYDPVLNLVQYGSTGICPASDYQRGVAGKNATLAGTNTRWAVRPETGEIVWRRQLLPQDNWDQECTFEMMIVDTPMRPNPNAEGMLAANPTIATDKVRTLVGMPCKNPVFWSLDAKTGEFFYARETFRGAQNLYDKIDPVTGLATMNQALVYDRPGKTISYCTSHGGGRDGQVAPAYDPKRNIMIQATGNICATGNAMDNRRPTPAFTYNVNERQVQNPNVAPMEDGQYPVGRITAVDVATGNTVWQYLQRPYNYSAVLATAGGLVFNGDAARYFFALDIDTGKKVWEVRLGSMCCGYPVSYSVDGRQYIAVVAGYGRNSLAPEIDSVSGQNMIYVFALQKSPAGR